MLRYLSMYMLIACWFVGIAGAASDGKGAVNEEEKATVFGAKIIVPVQNFLVIKAAQEGDIENIRRFLPAAKSVYVDIPDEKGRTALWHAAAGGHGQLITYLMTVCGACCFRQDFAGETPVTIASKRGHQELAEIFKKCAAAQIDCMFGKVDKQGLKP